MNKFKFRFLCLIISISAATIHLYAQNEFEGTVSFDRTIHNFGDILLSDGPQKCEFTLTNISNEAIVINRVITSCGCTEPNWTKKPIKPGEKGVIDITFSNDQGPYPFNKAITTYITGVSKPIILRIKGVSHEKEKTLKELFTYQIGALGFKEDIQDIGQIEQGLSRIEELEVANVSSKPIRVEFPDCMKGMELTLKDNPIPAGGKSVIVCKIDTKKTSEELWGKTFFTSKVSINGTTQKGTLQVKTLIKENFSSLTEAQKKTGSLIQFGVSSVNFGKVKSGTKIPAIFDFKNLGKEDLVIYKVDSSEPGTQIVFSPSTKAGERGYIKVEADTKGLPAEEMLYILTVITNCPTRPIVNIFITGTIE